MRYLLLLSVMTAAALIALLMAAVEALPVMVSTLVFLAVVVPAFMTFSMVMPALVAFPVVMAVVIAFSIGIILQCTLCQSLSGRIGRTGDTAVELDARLGQRSLRAHANAAADQRVHLCGFQKSGQCTVAAAVGGYDLLRDDFPVLHVIELELLRVAEMLEDLSVFVSYCNSHSIRSFLHDVFCSLIVELIVSTPDQEAFPVYQRVGDFPSRTLIDSCHSGAGNPHPFGALLLRQAFAVEKTDRLKLIQTQHNGFLVRYFLRGEFPMIRVAIDPSTALFSGHRRTSFLTYVEIDHTTDSDICQQCKQ